MNDGALIEAFLEMLSAERAARVNTLDAYRRDLDDARAEVRGGIAGAAAEKIEAYVAGLAKRGLSPATARRRTLQPQDRLRSRPLEKSQTVRKTGFR